MHYDLTKPFDPKGLKVLAEGKTKIAYEDPDPPIDVATAIFMTKDVLTANNDPSLTVDLPGVGAAKTTANDAFMRIFDEAGIETAYVGQVASNAFRAEFGNMALVESIWHAYNTGSQAERNPHLANMSQYTEYPITFHVKSGGGKLVAIDGTVLLQGLTAKEEDAIIVDPRAERWLVRHQYRGLHDPNPGLVLLRDLDPAKLGVNADWVGHAERTTRQIGALARATLGCLGYRTLDGKVELLRNGNVGDVYDLDSQRVHEWSEKKNDWMSIDKDPFRKGGDPALVLKNYVAFADRIRGWQPSRQAIVCWRGSNGDELPEAEIRKLKSFLPAGIDFVDVVASAHKTPERAMAIIQYLRDRYPQGFVIITFVGRSNGAGPLASARSIFPVVTCSNLTKIHEFLSGIDTPSLTPTTGTVRAEQALLAAIRMLAMSNPLLQAKVDLGIQELVGNVIAPPAGQIKFIELRA